jgi:hypothetical protein
MKTSKTESVSEFLARGGKISKVPMYATSRRTYAPAKTKMVAEKEQVDMSALPEALKIKYGVK